jgi:hypothetical protein
VITMREGVLCGCGETREHYIEEHAVWQCIACGTPAPPDLPKPPPAPTQPIGEPKFGELHGVSYTAKGTANARTVETLVLPHPVHVPAGWELRVRVEARRPKKGP